MLVSNGYIEGVSITYHDNERVVVLVEPRITLQGLEYLSENLMTKRAAKLAKGIKDSVTFI